MARFPGAFEDMGERLTRQAERAKRAIKSIGRDDRASTSAATADSAGSPEHDIACWRTRALDCERMLRSINGLIFRLVRDGAGGYEFTFIEGGAIGSAVYSSETWRGRKLSEAAPTDLYPTVAAAIEVAFAGGRGLYEDRGFPAGGCSEGVVLPFSRDAEGNVTEVVCTLLDVSARKMAEMESREKQERLEALVSALPDLVFIFDREGTFVGYNIANEEKLLASPGNFLGARLEDILPAEVADVSRRTLNNVVLTGQKGEFHYRLDLDGVEHYFHARMVPFAGDKVMAVVRNVSEIVETIRQDRMKGVQLDIMARVSRLGYWSTNVRQRKIYWSPEAFDLVGLDAVDEVTPEWIGQVLGSNTLEVIKSAILDAVTMRRFRQIEIRRELGGGRIRYLVMSMEPVIMEDGVVEELHGTVQDITALRELEFQMHHLQKIDSLGRVAGAMAHDFNNMLQIINGYGECLRKFVATDPTASSYLNAMLDASDRTKDLVASILSFSRRTEPVMHEMPLDQFVADTMNMVKPLMGASVRIELQSSGCECGVRLEKSAFTQVLVNLAVNARDAMADGGVLTFRTSCIDDEPERTRIKARWPWLESGQIASIEIRDTGCGIPEENLERIFAPFFSTKAEGAGTGLGLSTASQIVSRHGGALFVKETGSGGTTFQVLLPAFSL